MKASLPLLEAYLASLPRGLDSYPDYTQKASVYRQGFGRRYRTVLAPLVPQPLAGLLTDPVPISNWIPEVHVNALFVALYETLYREEDAFLRASRETARQLFMGPLYKALMTLASPELIVRRSQTGWTALHRGIVLDARPVGDHAADVRVAYPSQLVPRVVALTYAAAFHVSIEAAGGKRVECALAEHTPEHARYEITWK